MAIAKTGPGAAGPVVMYQPCPHCGRAKLYSRKQIGEILSVEADDGRIFTCWNKDCEGQIYVQPNLSLMKARGNTKGLRRAESGRMPALAKSGDSSKVVAAPAKPTVDDSVSYEDTIAVDKQRMTEEEAEYQLRTLQLMSRIREAAEQQAVFTDDNKRQYRCVKYVDQGCTAIVLLGQDLQTKERVVLKVYYDTLSIAEWSRLPTKRVNRSFGVQARFDCPQVVKPIAKFVHPEFGVVIVEPYVEGVPLVQALESETIGEVQALDVAKQLALYLIEAERLGIVHRDIKPANIMIDGNGNIKVIDFGLARDIKAKEGDGGATSANTQANLQALLRTKMKGDARRLSPEERQTLTMTYSGKAVNNRKVDVVGSPAYMSPEQVLGATVDERADQYSVAATLFHMLTGVPPIDGTSLEDLLDRVVSEDPRPAWVVAEERGILVSKDFSGVLHKALCKDREERYPNAQAFLQALQEVQPITGVPLSPVRRHEGNWWTMPVILAATAVLCFLFLFLKLISR